MKTNLKLKMQHYLLGVMFVCLLSLPLTSGCWLAIGAAGAGAAYEYNTKQQLDELEADYEAGNLTEKEYRERKQDIEEGSVIY